MTRCTDEWISDFLADPPLDWWRDRTSRCMNSRIDALDHRVPVEAAAVNAEIGRWLDV
jgi:hypothetical protein